MQQLANTLAPIIVAHFIVLPGRAAEVQPLRAAPEFRAAWVATVANIDWPSRRDLSVSQQQAELTALFDRAAELNLNAIVFQVRPAADAMYASELEPWSPYLTGEMGQGPNPHYDPLEFAVAQARARGLQLHAWFNPYRVRHPTAPGVPAGNHISRTRPELVRSYGKYLWLDPGEPAAADHSLGRDRRRGPKVPGRRRAHRRLFLSRTQSGTKQGRHVPFPDD